MPSAVWSGTISFGLVSVPVQLYSVTDSAGPELHQYHAEDGGRIRYKRVCEVDGQELQQDDIARGYPVGDDEVIITDRDLDGLPEVAKKIVAIDAIVREDQIDPIQYRKAYYVAPEKAGLRPYVLLRNALAKAGRAAVVTFAMRERESLALVRARDDLLLLETLFWPDEVREIPVEAPPAIDDKTELKAAVDLIEAMTSDFKPEQYHNLYREALQEVIEAKEAGREVTRVEQPKEDAGAKVTDLLSALRASVERAKETRGEGEKPAAKKRAKKAA
ncbi:Ku protein [Catenulispora acidiphila DSM 44928]|uniref:Non-homologous end joining protein Ku n=1 Tax=Catenulispora acidiphila (strain DSM 44928 / JCM 14897 / NBRC 102108 / NRRL B-24433 / ID139908) TaxID=479433 RepID=C7Q2W9_CATAD|nr:Ku protein [Catenulispora acidiphila]ACU71861.1 Ku protein [Catenulispora acidiphila DSM 44928]